MLLDDSFSSSAILMKSPEMLIHVYFCSGVSVRGTTCSQTWRTFNTRREEYRDNFLHKYQQIMPFGPQFPSVTSHNPSHMFNIASFIGVEGRPTCKRLCHTYTWNFLIDLSLHPWFNMVNVSAGEFCSKKKNWYSYFIQVDILNINTTTCTINKQTNKCCYALRAY
jgi:hypothetical protein